MLNDDSFDSVLIVASSGSLSEYQQVFADEFIDCKTRFKRMKNRSVKFFAIDINANAGVQGIGIDTEYSFPNMFLYPAHGKGISMYRYDGDADFLSMAEFIHKNSDTKFDLKIQYFLRERVDSELPQD